MKKIKYFTNQSFGKLKFYIVEDEEGTYKEVKLFDLAKLQSQGYELIAVLTPEEQDAEDELEKAIVDADRLMEMQKDDLLNSN